MNRDDAIALIRSSKLADRLDRLVPHLAPGMRIRTTRDLAAGKALVSRFAGNGVLPRGTAWPVWDSSALDRRWIEYSRASMVDNKGSSQRFWNEQIERYEASVRENPKPLHFLAMVRIEDVAKQAAQLGLPDCGALLFFYDVERCQGSFWPEARGGWQVLYAQDANDLILVENPPVHVAEFQPFTLAFEVQYSLPEDIRAATGDANLRVYGNAEYERVHGELLASSRTDQVIHQLCGAPQEVQHGLFLQCQLASNGLDCGNAEDYRQPRVRELERGAKDWRLLLQIDSEDDGPGWMWGDVGRLYYCMHQDDLAASRFERSWCAEQSG